LLPALLITTGSGAIIGLLQGALVAFAGANPIITTIAMSSIITGIGVLWTRGHTIFGSGDASWLASGQMIPSLPNQIVVLLVFVAAVSFLFARTRIGREIYLIGMNPSVAEFSGLRTELATCVVYTIAGFSAALSGTLISSSAAQGNMTYGIDLDFNAIAAVLVGGISIRGGRGKVLDALVGALFLTVIGNLLLISGARYETQFLVKGAVVLGSVVLGTMLLRLSPRFFSK
jgi:ribose/xylose/arabinose/galactoside ABC-type transport system permease subunit